ncbi:MAG TPA: hypothetical protein VKS81_02370, partial [Bacteroidota bacterium]|nr:hypothetical protein [Bacteroidota bacterium]
MNKTSNGYLWFRGAAVAVVMASVLLLPAIFSSCKDISGPSSGLVSNNTATVSGIVYSQIGTAERQVLPGAVVSIRSTYYNADTLTNANGAYTFVMTIPDTVTTSVNATVSASKTPVFNLQSENLIIKPGSTTSASFTLTTTDTTTVTQPSGVPSSISFVSATNSFGNVQGSSGVLAVSYTFVVRDSSGIPVDAAHQVLVRLSLSPSIGAGEHLLVDSALTAVTPDHRGQVTTTLVTGTKSGIVQIKATVKGYPALVAKSPSIPIYGGPPDASHFNMNVSSINFPALNATGLFDSVRVVLGDKMSNPVPTGSEIYFSSTTGIVQPAAATDSLGRAGVLLTSGAPAPAGGMAYVYAQTV